MFRSLNRVHQLPLITEVILNTTKCCPNPCLMNVRGKKIRNGLGGFERTPALNKIRGHATKRNPKLMSWQDYGERTFQNHHHWWHKFQQFRNQMEYGENLVRLGMSNWAINRIINLHPTSVDYIRRRLSGNVVKTWDGCKFKGNAPH